jgi:hypothetical protein
MYNLKIHNLPQSQKIPAIKLIRYLTGKGLKDSKDFVESLTYINEVASCNIETIIPLDVAITYLNDCYRFCQCLEKWPSIENAPIPKKGQNQHTKALANEQAAHASTKNELDNARLTIRQQVDSIAHLQNDIYDVKQELEALRNRNDGVFFLTTPDSIKVEAKLTVRSFEQFHKTFSLLQSIVDANKNA